MAQNWSKTTVFDATAEKLFDVLTNSDFQVAQRKNDSAVVDAEFHEVSRSDTRLEFEVRATEYERGMTGLNKKKTLKSVTKVNWDIKKLSGSWVYSQESQTRFKLSGTHKIEEAGDKARYISGFTVEVKVPLVGKKIEKLILEGMSKGRDGYDNLVRDHLKK